MEATLAFPAPPTAGIGRAAGSARHRQLTSLDRLTLRGDKRFLRWLACDILFRCCVRRRTRRMEAVAIDEKRFDHPSLDERDGRHVANVRQMLTRKSRWVNANPALSSANWTAAAAPFPSLS